MFFFLRRRAARAARLPACPVERICLLHAQGRVDQAEAVAAEADPGACSRRGESILEACARLKMFEACCVLVDNGADPFDVSWIRDPSGNVLRLPFFEFCLSQGLAGPALRCASLFGGEHLRRMENDWIARRGRILHPAARPWRSGCTWTHLAAAGKSRALAEWAQAAGLSRKCDDTGCSPLHAAAAKRAPAELALFLVEAGYYPECVPGAPDLETVYPALLTRHAQAQRSTLLLCCGSAQAANSCAARL